VGRSESSLSTTVMKRGVPTSQQADSAPAVEAVPRRPGVFGALGIADPSHSLRRITRRLGSLAPAMQVANTQSLFRGEGWGEGSTSPRFARKPTPHLTSPRTTRSQSSILTRGERDQTSGSLAPAVQMANTRSLFRGEGWGEGMALPPTRHSLFPSPSLSVPNTPGLRPAHLRHSAF
jgi:hypothetical protein